MRSVDEMRRLSALLDAALDRPENERAGWLDALPDDAAGLGSTLRKLLARAAAGETGDVLDRGPAFGAPAESAAGTLQPGDLVGPYRLLRRLGEGGMGEVWLAERQDGLLKRPVALKLPMLGLRRDVLVQRFARERDIVGALVHPNIARLYDADLSMDGQPYLALEYVDGVPITEHVQAHTPGRRAVVRLMLQVMAAVQHAHANLVIHRDLKPSNVLVTAEGRAMLLDFGIAKLLQDEHGDAGETELTRVGGRALTPAYAAPEQLNGSPVSIATDVWALGVLLYELLAGVRPFAGDRLALERAILESDPRPPAGTPTDLGTVVLKALKKPPTERYATVAAFAEDLQRWLDGHPVRARPDSRWYRLLKFTQRNRVGVGAATLAGLALLLGAALALWQAGVAREQARLAKVEARKAQEESRYAEAVSEFMTGLFKANASRQKNPAKARATTARELLDLGAGELGGKLQDVPEAKAEVLALLSEMYYQLELEDKAAELDQQRVDLLRTTLGPDHPRVAGALILLAGSLHSTSRRDRILPALEEARRILDVNGERRTGRRADLLVRLSQRHFNVSLVKARDEADEAAAILRAQTPVDRDMLSTALILAARARTGLGELADAERIFRDAVEEALQVPARPHFDVMQARFSQAEVMAMRGQVDAALPLARAAVADGAAALGAESPGVLAMRARLATLLFTAGLREEALALHREVLDAMLRVKGPDDTLYTPIARITYARSLLAGGWLAEAEALVAQVMPVYRRHYAGSTVLAGALRTEGELAALRGEQARALNLFDEALALWHAGSGGASAEGRVSRMWLDRARADWLAGDAAAAARDLQAVRPWPARDVPEPRVDDLERETLRSMVALAQGHTAAARRSADAAAALAARLGSEGRHAGPRADALLAQGRSRLADGDVAGALPALQQARALRRTFDGPHSPFTAAAEAEVGLALLHSGHRGEARQAAARAQAIVRRYLSPTSATPGSTQGASLAPALLDAPARLQAALSVAARP